ncbi:MAG: hypothetical protein QOH65_582 [Methylobacteriaceae bacterium]|jgi:hypothetical protein|nr:hypothetical protein [Methylobacteriaceae bacterium]
MSGHGCQCGQAHGACATEFQYAVKIVCGEMKPADNNPVAPGAYRTAINIHNPEKCKNANFRWKVAVAAPNEQGTVSSFRGPRVLPPDAAMEIDCPQVMNVFKPPLPFIKGYAVFESDVELDVVAVYTGAQTATGPLTTFYTERVQARCVPKCEDLVLPFHTGVADWRTVVPATHAPVVLIPTAGWGAPPSGTRWVSQFGPDLVQDPRTYELTFDLCSGFDNPSPPCEIQVQVNDTATVFLNGTQVGATVPLLSTPTTLTLPASLRAGSNTLQVRVTNVGGQTGFAMAGILQVPRGKCPCVSLPMAAKV